MKDFDTTVSLYDNDGNEVIFEVIHFCEYKGETYTVLWGKDDDDEDVFVITRVDADGGHEVVHDDEILSFVHNSLRGGMNDLMDDANAYAAESDLEHGQSGIPENNSGVETLENDEKGTDTPDSTDIGIKIAPFDSAKYLQQSQDFLFAQGCAAYDKAEYDKALSAFTKADAQGNIYSAARLGLMHHYGYGCQQDQNAAFELFIRGAECGCPLAAAWISEYYRLGHGVEQDKERAQAIYDSVDSDLRRMCDAGDSAALYFLGYNLVMGIFGDEDEAEGVRLLTRACEKGELRAAVQLAECYYNGWGVTKDARKAVELLMKNPLPSNKKAQYILGLCNYYGNGTEKNLHRAFLHFKSAASLGHGRAKDYLGDCYLDGLGTSINYQEAIRWYKDAADNHGIGNSAIRLAFMYLNGEGVPESKETALQYFLIAAEKGIAQAQRIVSHGYLTGDCFEQDYEAARIWMEKAAERGDVEAQVGLGRYYLCDFGFYDENKAFEWLMKAANKGNSDAEYLVGGCYAYQFGVPQDYRKANEWFAKAAEAGHGKAKIELGRNYLEGNGIEKDGNKGLELLLQAFRMGEQDASKDLAAAYYNGIENYNGQAKYTDPAEAYKYAIDAAQDEKDGGSQYILASILHKSQGKVEEAMQWYVRASENGNEKAALELSKLYIERSECQEDAFRMLKELSDKSIAEAQYYLGMCCERGFGCLRDKKAAKNYYQLAALNGYASDDSPKKKRFGLF